MRKFFAMVALHSEHSIVVMTSQPRENSSGRKRCPAGQGNVLSQCHVIHVSGKALANLCASRTCALLVQSRLAVDLLPFMPQC